LALALALELWARTHYEAGSHLLGQRQSEYHGNASLALLLLALAARPLARVWPWPLRHRRALGVLAFGFAAAHTGYAFEHTLGGSLETLAFLTPARQAALWLGIGSLALLLPLFLTSNDLAVRRLGRRWTPLHRLAAPALVLAVVHTAWMGVHYGLQPVTFASAALLAPTAALLAARFRKARR
jgi:DMSO/TMAO reductase YedYZ heme-binding membrane subunit